MGAFATINVVDFEYEVEPGELPRVLCMVAHVLNENLQHVRTIRMWRGEFGKSPPLDNDGLFVAYSAWAEMTCFLTLGWEFPEHVFDLHTAYLAASNILLPYNPDEARKRQRKRLPDACRAYGVEGWERIDKDTMAEDIGNGLWRKYGKKRVLEYCEEDVKKSAELLRAMLRPRRNSLIVDVPRVLHWSNYSAKAVARIQARGIPIDMPLWNLIQENKESVVVELLRQFDPSHGSDDPIYNAAGEWSYTRFEHWLVRTGVTAWPRLESGQLDTDSDAFRAMYHLPGIERLHALRDSLGVLTRSRLSIGRDGRNRPSLFPFCTATGRNAHAKSLFNAHAGLRSLIAFPPHKIGLYLDWRTQEVGVAAARSECPKLQADYRGGDVYHALALASGLTDDPDPKHWKSNNEDVRQRMKALQLGINYGMSVPSLARGLDRHPLIASDLIERHRRTHPRFWEWREEEVQRAMLERRIETVFGWPLHLSTSPNKRTLYNFPMQGNGAEMLRLAAWRLCEIGIVPCMLVHDGILFELDNKEQTAPAIDVMRWAGREVCDGFEIDVDVDKLLENGERYRDKRPVAKAMWATVMRALQNVGALAKETLPWAM